jgi:hypothetical protein
VRHQCQRPAWHRLGPASDPTAKLDVDGRVAVRR